MPHLSPTTLTTDEQRLILRATSGNVRDHTIISVALGTGLPDTRRHNYGSRPLPFPRTTDMRSPVSDRDG